MALVLSLCFVACASAQDDATNRPDCGYNDDPGPNFTLEDVNPTSPTYGQQITLSDYDDKVIFIMFIRSSCGHCQSLSTYLNSYMEANDSAWGGQVLFLMVNMIGWEDDIAEFTSLHNLPTLQDTSAAHVAEDYGAYLYWNYLLKPGRELYTFYYSYSLPAYESRLLGEIQEALGAAK